MYPKNTPDMEYPADKKHNGTRKDGRNLVEEWTDRVKDKVKDESVPSSRLQCHIQFHSTQTLQYYAYADKSLFSFSLCVCLPLVVYFRFDDMMPCLLTSLNLIQCLQHTLQLRS